MSRNIAEIPFTEIIERTQRLARSGDNTYPKIRGIVQDIYNREISSKYDWNFLMVTSGFQTVDEYKTGTVTINTNNTNAVFSSDAVLTAAMVGRKIKFDSNPVVYDITSFGGTTGVTISPSLQGPSNLSAAGYTIFQPSYALAGDFDRFPKNGGIYRWVGGRKEVLKEESFQEQSTFFQSSPTSTPERVRLSGTDTAGNVLVTLQPAPNKAENFGYEYIRQLKPLLETTAGTLSSVAASATAVLGNTNTRFLEALTDGTFWFRVDALGTHQDSNWYRILAIQNDSSLTLATAFANTAITSSANYTIARTPEMPARLHAAILYGTLEKMTRDQNDDAAGVYRNEYAMTLSDSKRIYVSRTYSQKITGAMEDWRYRR